MNSSWNSVLGFKSEINKWPVPNDRLDEHRKPVTCLATLCIVWINYQLSFVIHLTHQKKPSTRNCLFKKIQHRMSATKELGKCGFLIKKRCCVLWNKMIASYFLSLILFSALYFQCFQYYFSYFSSINLVPR